MNTAPGPLRPHPANPRYFSDGSDRAVYLTGSHTWGNFQDQLSPAPLRAFDFDAYLDWMQEHGFNFMRGWAWEQASWDHHTPEKLEVRPLPYARTGPGEAIDEEPKFDLSRFNPEYFDRVRARVSAAGERGIYVSVMLFERFSVINEGAPRGNPWRGHPFHAKNNVNGIDGDPDQTGNGKAVHTLAIPAVTAIQESYVRRVVDAVNDLDNVLYEIGNEHHEASAPWQCHLVDLIHAYEATKPKQHPVGMTSGGGGADAVTNAQLFSGPADWISPRHEKGQPYRDDPPPADGSKVVLPDTDHLWGLGANVAWVWKSFTRGLQPILMDPYEPLYGLDEFPNWGPLNKRDNPLWGPVRRNMGHTLAYARRMDLARMTPRGDLASSGYCLADAGAEYLVYSPSGETLTVDLGEARGCLTAEWLSPADGRTTAGQTAQGGTSREFTVPFDEDAVLYLRASEEESR